MTLTEVVAEWDAARDGPRPPCYAPSRVTGIHSLRRTHRWSAPDREFEPHGIQRQVCGRCWCVRLTRRGRRPRHLHHDDARTARERARRE